jgi:hypothetical protein
MEHRRRSRIILAIAGLAAFTAEGARASMDWASAREFQRSGERSAATKQMVNVLRNWPADSRKAANAIIEEYGVPDMVLSGKLRWNGRRPWKRIEVFRDALSADRPDRLLQSVAYAAPAQRLPALGSFEHGVAYDPAAGELSARTESEATNRLVLNLADEIVRERRGVADAIAFYDKTLSLSVSGKSSPYLDTILFTR